MTTTIPKEIRAEQRVRVVRQTIERLRLRAANPKRTTEEQAAANSEANRLSNLLRDREN